MIDTKITRLLDSHGVLYRILPHAEPVFTVEMAAAQRGVVWEEMVKSILLRERNSQRFVMACATGDTMAGLELEAEDLIRVAGATLGPIAAPKE